MSPDWRWGAARSPWARRELRLFGCPDPHKRRVESVDRDMTPIASSQEHFPGRTLLAAENVARVYSQQRTQFTYGLEHDVDHLDTLAGGHLRQRPGSFSVLCELHVDPRSGNGP
jgi:hypothetical protein